MKALLRVANDVRDLIFAVFVALPTKEETAVSSGQQSLNLTTYSEVYFVATIQWSRTPRSFIHSPRMISLSSS